jgi:hypothetical protein
MISLHIVNSLVSGYFVEGHPLCSSDAPGYHDFVKSPRVSTRRGDAMGLLLKVMSRSVGGSKTVYWFEGGDGHDVGKGGGGVGRWEAGTKRMPLGKTATWINESRKRLKVEGGTADFRFAVESVAVLEKIGNILLPFILSL